MANLYSVKFEIYSVNFEIHSVNLRFTQLISEIYSVRLSKFTQLTYHYSVNLVTHEIYSVRFDFYSVNFRLLLG